MKTGPSRSRNCEYWWPLRPPNSSCWVLCGFLGRHTGIPDIPSGAKFGGQKDLNPVVSIPSWGWSWVQDYANVVHWRVPKCFAETNKTNTPLISWHFCKHLLKYPSASASHSLRDMASSRDLGNRRLYLLNVFEWNNSPLIINSSAQQTNEWATHFQPKITIAWVALPANAPLLPQKSVSWLEWHNISRKCHSPNHSYSLKAYAR